MNPSVCSSFSSSSGGDGCLFQSPSSKLSFSSVSQLGRNRIFCLDSEGSADGIQIGLGTRKSSSFFKTYPFSSSFNASSPVCSRPRSGFSFGKTSYLSSSRLSNPRVLQSSLYSTQENRRFQTCPRPFSAQQIPQTYSFQNGNVSFGSSSNLPRRLVGFDRPVRCILPCTHSSKGQEMAEILLERSNVPIQRPSVWFKPVSMGFLASNKGSCSLGSDSGHSPHILHGRLAHPRQISSTLSEFPLHGHGENFNLGLQNQLQQIRPLTFSGVSFPGHDLQHSGLDHQTRQESSRISSLSTSFSEKSFHSVSPFPSVSSRENGIHFVSDSSGSGLQTTTSESNGSSFQPCCSWMEFQNQNTRLGQGVNRFLDGHSPSSSSSSHLTSKPCLQVVCRCISPRMGSSHFVSNLSGSLGTRTNLSSHQLSGTVSCERSSFFPFSIHSSRSCDDHVRQCDGSFIDQSSRRHTLSLPFDRSRGNSSLVLPEGLDPLGNSSERKSQHHGRFAESPERSHSDRMDPLLLNAPKDLGSLGQTNARSVCDKAEQTSPSLRFSSTGRHGSRHRRSKHGLEESGSLRLPSIFSDSKNLEEVQVGSSSTNPDHSVVAINELVQSTSSPVPHSSSSAGHKIRRSVSASHKHASRKSTEPKSSRLASMRKKLHHKGLSKQAVDYSLSAQRVSTQNVYQNHWKWWLSWCENNDVNPSSPSEVDIGNHLAFVAHTYKVSPSYIKVRRSAISSTLLSFGSPIPDSSIVSQVVKGISLLSSKSKKRTPDWDVRLILEFLQGPPFEPLEYASLKHVTLKTCFLLALASGRRASEICHLSGRLGDIAYDRHGSVSLFFLPEFLAKNQNPQDCSPTLFIKSLNNIVGQDDPDMVNCPVRALRSYRKRTKSVRSPSQRKLFISFNPNMSKDIHASSISRWIRTVIVDSYKFMAAKSQHKDSLLPLISPRAHEVRAWSSTLAFRSVSAKDLLASAYWRSPDVFISFYLRDVARNKEDGTWGLPACVAANVPLASSRK